MKILSHTNATKFKCLQADCPDTCCKGWSMQLDDKTFEKYKGTEFENAVSYDGRNNEIRVMKRDPKTDYCVKFTDGICGIHKEKGDSYLGDACHFYPRVTRKLTDDVVMTATMSCPEVTRIALFEPNLEYTEQEIERLPSTLKDYEGDLKVHQMFLDLFKADETSERIVKRIYSASASLDAIDKSEWQNAAGLFLKIGAETLPAPDRDDNDQYFVLQLFAGMIHATHKPMPPRLSAVIWNIENGLGVKINWKSLQLEQSFAQPKIIKSGLHYNDILKKYLEAQISFNTYPYAGIGETLADRAKVLMYKYALVKLALKYSAAESEQQIVDVIQPISRIVDHVGDATLMLNIMNSFGWDQDSRLLGALL